MTGHKGTASRSRSVSLQHSSLPCYLFSCPSTHSSWLPYLAICALVCALWLFVHIRTKTHPDFYLPVFCRIHNERKPKLDSQSLGFFPSMSLGLKCKCTYRFHFIEEKTPYHTLSELIYSNSSCVYLYLQYASLSTSGSIHILRDITDNKKWLPF